MKFIQIYYRVYYLLIKKWRSFIEFKQDWNNKNDRKRELFQLIPSIQLNNSFSNNSFVFLNLEHKFIDEINWNYNKFGKLWIYNLNYFDFLNQKEISLEEGLYLIHSFIDNIESIKDGLEPFPISLRLMNWVKFIVRHNIDDVIVINNIYVQFSVLEKNIEYHLLGNHLLENLFALVSTSAFFNNLATYEKYSIILQKQLDEQILDDGGHFELSPMYHQIMLFRLLDTINILKHSELSADQFILFLKNKASEMLGWLNQITFKNGQIPLLNDSAYNITPDTKALNEYSKRLNIEENRYPLSESGYRVFQTDVFELIADVGKVGPDYIPGHAHSDTFNFVMHYNGKPFIVDTGLSTYEKGETRDVERSTSSHNTVMVNGLEQSQMWGGFRVGERAKASILTENDKLIQASHDGYRKWRIYHQRTFDKRNNLFVITDRVIGKSSSINTAYLHFHPSVTIDIMDDTIITSQAKIQVEGNKKIEIGTYFYSLEFNKRIPAKKVIISFDNSLITTIQ